MRIVIVGAGKIGTALTQQLSMDHRVTVIDQNARLIENIINVYELRVYLISLILFFFVLFYLCTLF